jgi:hypothetical protein
MSKDTLKALDRELARLERRQRRGPRRFPKSAITLVLGLLLGQQLLGRLVPMVWGAVMTEGLWVELGTFGRAIALGSEFCQTRGATVTWGIGGIGLAAVLLGFGSPMFRRLTWLAAVMVLLFNGAVVVKTFQTSAMVAAHGL